MFRKIKRYIRDPYHEIGYDMLWKHPNWMSDKWYLKALWKRTFGYELDLKHPKTFNEKLQWLKLYDRRPEYTIMVDKYRAKQWVAERVGEEYIIPTLAVYQSVDEIDLDKLPNQFVLKCNHDSGNVVICRDKSTFDLEAAKQKLAAALRKDYYLKWREWPYKNVKRCVFAEEYLKGFSGTEVADYKFFCFDGSVKAMFVATERFSDEVKFDFYDSSFNHLDICQIHPMSGRTIQKPAGFEDMKDIASRLSKGFPHIRVDMYEVEGRIYCGEITLYHHAGFEPFHPNRWDAVFGDWIDLPLD